LLEAERVHGIQEGFMAKRHPSRRKIAQEPHGHDDDAFVAGVFEASTWAKKNSQLLILAGIAAFLLIGGLVYYMGYRGEQRQLAIAELERVQQTAIFGLPEEAEAELSRYIQRFGDTPYGSEARVLLGQLQLFEGRPQDAILTLQAVSSSRGALGPQAGMLLGRAFEEAGRHQDAERQYLQVAGAAPMDFQRAEALADAARMRSQLGSHAGAAELYRRILDALDATSRERGYYEMRLAEEEQLANS